MKSYLDIVKELIKFSVGVNFDDGYYILLVVVCCYFNYIKEFKKIFDNKSDLYDFVYMRGNLRFCKYI